MKSRSLWVVTALLAALCLWIVLRGGSSEPIPTGAPSTPDQLATDALAATAASAPAPDESATTRRSATSDDARRLQVEIVDREGRPAPGKLAVSTTAQLPAFSVGAELTAALVDQRIKVIEHAGAVDLEWPSATWLSMQASGVAGLASALLAPSESDSSVRLVLDPSSRQLRVIVVESDLFTPVRAGSITVREYQAPEGAAQSTPISSDGVATIELGERSDVLIGAPGSESEAGEPFVVRVQALLAPLPFERLVTVVRPGRRADLSIEVHVEGEASSDLLVLRRVDDGSYAEATWSQALHTGVQTASFRLDEGDYQVVTWPLGHLALDRGETSLRVRGPTTRARLRCRASTERVALRLVGIESWKLPIHVLPQPCDGVLSNGACGAFVGPWTWRDVKQELAPVPEPVRLVAHGSQGTWISAAAWDGRACLVNMVVATRVDVSWQPDRMLAARAWVEVRSALGDEVIPLRREVMRVRRGPVAGFVGSCFLPAGAIELRCMIDTGGETVEVWRRDVDARNPRCEVNVAGVQ